MGDLEGHYERLWRDECEAGARIRQERDEAILRFQEGARVCNQTVVDLVACTNDLLSAKRELGELHKSYSIASEEVTRLRAQLASLHTAASVYRKERLAVEIGRPPTVALRKAAEALDEAIDCLRVHGNE